MTICCGYISLSSIFLQHFMISSEGLLRRLVKPIFEPRKLCQACNKKLHSKIILKL